MMEVPHTQQKHEFKPFQPVQYPPRQPQQHVKHVGTLAHTHSHTVVWSHLQQHTHKVTLIRPWAPGQDGNPEATLNTAAFCDELNARLLGVDATLLSMLQARRRPAAAAAGSMEACRQQLEDSLEKQVAFSTALMLDWCGATPVGSSEQVLQQLLST